VNRRTLVLAGIVAPLAGVALAAGFAPFLYSEYALREAHEVVGPKPVGAVRGRWFDDYFLVESIEV